MKKFCLFALPYLFFSSLPCLAQDHSTLFREIKSSYAESGSVAVLDEQILLIEPKMPGPVCALPKIEGEKTTWSFFAFPLASITVPLADVDETLIGENMVFTRSDAKESYKPGDIGDTTMVIIVAVPGKHFRTLTYDREKFIRLGSGPHSTSGYGQIPDNVDAFGLTFSDHASATAFEAALKKAVLLAKGQTAHR